MSMLHSDSNISGTCSCLEDVWSRDGLGFDMLIKVVPSQLLV